MDIGIKALQRGVEVLSTGTAPDQRLVSFGEEPVCLLIDLAVGQEIACDCLLVTPYVQNQDIVGGEYMEYTVVIADGRGMRVQQDFYACKQAPLDNGVAPAYAPSGHIPMVGVGGKLVGPLKVWCRN